MIDPWFLRELRALATEGDGTEGLERTYLSVDTCAAEFEARTPYFYQAMRGGRTGPARSKRGRALGRHPRLGSQPDRAGDRIRLLLRPRCDDRPGARARRGDDQLQPRDGLHRLRHLRPPLLRAAHHRGRPRGLRDREARGRDRPVRRTDPSAPGEGAGGGGGPASRHPGRCDRPRRGPRSLRRAAEAARDQASPYGTALSADEAVAIAEDVGFSALVRPSYVLGGRAMEICYSADALSTYLEQNVKADQEHPLLDRSSRTRSRSMWTRSPTATSASSPA